METVNIHLLDHVDDWNKIRLADGKVGWIEKYNFEKILFFVYPFFHVNHFNYICVTGKRCKNFFPYYSL